MIQTIRKNIVPVLIGFVGAMGLFWTLSSSVETGRESVVYSNSFFSVWVCILSVVLYKKSYEKISKANRKSILFAGMFSLALSFALNGYVKR